MTTTVIADTGQMHELNRKLTQRYNGGRAAELMDNDRVGDGNGVRRDGNTTKVIWTHGIEAAD